MQPMSPAEPMRLRSLRSITQGTNPGGADQIKLDDLAAPDDNTDLNASAAKHGLLPKLSNVATEFLNGQGAFAAPATAAHHANHESGGSDEIKLDDLKAPDDNTDLNVSTMVPSGFSI